MRNEELAERGRREFEARDREAKAQVLEYARGWERTFRAMAAEEFKRGRCLCTPVCAADDGELDHTNLICPVLIYLRLARLMIEDAERRCLPG
jgi:hypothetical protein